MCRTLRPIAVGLLITCAVIAKGDTAERSAANQLPHTTVAYLTVQNTRELVERAHQTALGMAFQDPQVRPLVEHLWSSVVPTLQQFEEKVGMTLDELVAAAPGQLVVALVAVPSADPAAVLMFRPERSDEFDKTLERGTGRLTEAGFEDRSEEVAGAEARILSRDEGDLREVIQLRLDDWRLVTTDRQVAARLVGLWRGVEDAQPSLAEHSPFRAIMTRCTPEGSGPAQIDWYVDPIGIFRAVTRENFAASAGLALASAIGIDGLQAVGGRVTVADETYDMITRTHILLEPPRDGVLQVVALRQGTSEPEAWVPADTAEYVTWQWDVQQAFATLKELVDSFRGDGALASMVKSRLSEPLGIDVQQDLLPLIGGRITYIVRYEQPPSMTSQSVTIGAEVTDPARFAELWSDVVSHHADSIEKTNFAGVEVYKWKRKQGDAPAEQPQTAEPTEPESPAGGAEGEQQDESDAERQRQRRRERREREARQRWQKAEPVAALIGDYLVVSDRMSSLQQIVMTYDDAQPRLKDELDYKLVVSRLKRQTTTQPGMIRFQRPEEGLRMMYQLLQTDDMRAQIHEQRERHAFFQALDELLTENRLPPFEVLARYLAPGGSMLVNEESGFYHVSFGLRRQLDKPLGTP